ncbi:hypothetical protein [Malacoplasma iowae]|uniref:hypothetical protein n=1 Tax=Malacoplasma iowae TaxID=2116 RepID=UPI003872F107|nr:hypothetical protein QX181_04950 [Malacoplasma iowae]
MIIILIFIILFIMILSIGIFVIFRNKKKSKEYDYLAKEIKKEQHKIELDKTKILVAIEEEKGLKKIDELKNKIKSLNEELEKLEKNKE